MSFVCLLKINEFLVKVAQNYDCPFFVLMKKIIINLRIIFEKSLHH